MGCAKVRSRTLQTRRPEKREIRDQLRDAVVGQEGGQQPEIPDMFQRFNIRDMGLDEGDERTGTF